jgi:hypothetical protein
MKASEPAGRGKISQAAQVADLGEDQLLESQAHGPARAGNHEDDPAPGEARQGSGEQGRGADLFVGELPEDLPEAGHHPFEQGLDTFGCHVAGRDPGPAGQDHRSPARGLERLGEGLANGPGLVAHHLSRQDGVTRTLEQLGDQGSARVALEIAGVADGDDGRGHVDGRGLAVMVSRGGRGMASVPGSVAMAAHGCSSTQYSPSVATSFFQMGTVSFRVSMA